MWSFPLSADDAALFAPIVEAFNAEYPNVTIDIQYLPWNGRYEKMLTAIAGGEAPNVVYLNDFQVPLFAATDNLGAYLRGLHAGGAGRHVYGRLGLARSAMTARYMLCRFCKTRWATSTTLIFLWKLDLIPKILPRPGMR